MACACAVQAATWPQHGSRDCFEIAASIWLQKQADAESKIWRMSKGRGLMHSFVGALSAPAVLCSELGLGTLAMGIFSDPEPYNQFRCPRTL
jgi:hypothetical protein